MTLEGKSVLVTGASEGIGAACAAAFRQRGAKLTLTARNEAGLRAVAAGDDAVVAGDLTLEATRRQTVEAALDRHGGLDILVNNAGVGLYAPTWLAPEADVRAMFELNFFAALGMIRLAVPPMRERRGGLVVNISSIAGQVALPWFTLYSAGKYAVNGLSDGLRMELRREGIGVMLVCPGYVKTGFQDHALAGKPPARLRRSKKFAITPEQCAEAIARGVERDARTVVAPGAGRFLVGLSRLWPALAERMLLSQYYQLDEEAA
ncbi:MAG: SDR family NAD(P)-dependent oxidoreductase [Bryobacterales bacterium]|nr:SDR family NAD(P)-dependent oxidoreductase [Bryobacterales bacterium]